ncbi:TIGR00297 family protein [Methanobrevibacter sp. DSM 116169]|uniref:TIGR00297 family protein n=1 Tax=Methanobrevibacter sp. DSM 116169 TaxID=3242727 RepID=UPI0038FD37F6
MINWGYVIILFILGFITYKRRALDFLGSLFMVVMGVVIIFSAGVSWLLIILLFLILSLFATKFAKPYKRSLGKYEGQRNAINVISNGIVAFMFAAFGSYYLPFAGGFIGAVATATSDTLASEIGILKKPRLITTMEEVEPGTDGAISILGTAVGIVGAGVIGIVGFILGVISDPFVSIKVAVIAGTLGCFVDSILGAVLERKGVLKNEHVNLIATISGAFLGVLLVI